MSNPCDLAIGVHIINIINRLSSTVILSGLGVSSTPQGEGFLPPQTSEALALVCNSSTLKLPRSSSEWKFHLNEV